ISAVYNDTTSDDVTGEAQYASDDVSVVTVSADGVVTAVANGTANIYVTYGYHSIDVPVLVNAARQLDSIYASISSVYVKAGLTTNINVTAFFDDDSA